MLTYSRVLDKDRKRLLFVGTFADGKISGPCWRFSASDRFYFGRCDGLHRFVPNSDVVVGSPNDEEVFTCKATNDEVGMMIA
jgi:hypothetical protein